MLRIDEVAASAASSASESEAIRKEVAEHVAALSTMKAQCTALEAEHSTQVQALSAERDSLLAQVADLTNVVSGARKLKAALEVTLDKLLQTVEVSGAD